MNPLNLERLGLAAFRSTAWVRCALVCCALIFTLKAMPLYAQADTAGSAYADPKWFVSMSLGEGQLKLQSDEKNSGPDPSFSIGFDLGRRIGPWARAGAEVNGWLMQAFDLNNPGVGESVGHVMAIGDALPLKNHPLFLRGGIGRSSYTNNRPTGNNGGGLAWHAGGGYEMPVSRSVRLVPTAGYSAGRLGDGGTPIPQTHFRYSVVEFKLAVLYRFGK